jgi:hypothetical protein
MHTFIRSLWFIILFFQLYDFSAFPRDMENEDNRLSYDDHSNYIFLTSDTNLIFVDSSGHRTLIINSNKNKTTNSGDNSFLCKVFEIFIVSITGIGSALLTDYVTKRKREKNKNIWEGNIATILDIEDRYHNSNWGKSVAYCFANEDIELFYAKKRIKSDIISYFDEPLNDIEDAKNKGDKLIIQLRTLFNN